MCLACVDACVGLDDSLSKVWLRVGGVVVACSTCGGSVVGMRRASSGEASSCLKAGGKGRERGFCSSSGSIVEELFLGVVEAIPSDVVVSWLAGKVTDEDGAVGSEASFLLVGAGEKASPPPSTATRIPETGGAEVFGSLGALGGLSRDLRAFHLAIVKQRGGAKTTEKLSARGDGSGKRKRRDVHATRDGDAQTPSPSGVKVELLMFKYRLTKYLRTVWSLNFPMRMSY